MAETALTVLSEKEVAIYLNGLDTTGMSAEDKQALAMILAEDMGHSSLNIVPKPQQLKINKDTCQFYDGLGNSFDEAVGVMLHKMMTRGFWIKKSKTPICSSLDCRTGRITLNEELFNAAKAIPGLLPANLAAYDFAMLAALPVDEAQKLLTRSCKGCPLDAWGSAVGDDGGSRGGKACKEMRRVYLFQQNAVLPVKITLPPTSINVWDDYISGRLTNRITDLSAMVILRLAPKSSGSFTWAVATPKLGARLKPADIVQMAQMRAKFVDAWSREEVTADDYDTEPTDDVSAHDMGAAPGQETVAY